MDIGKSFTFVFDDPDWLKKILIGGLITMIPIVNFAAMGYVAELVRTIRDEPNAPLPEWDNFGGYFSDGLKLLVAFIVYSLPLLLIMCVFFGVTAAMGGFSENIDDTTGGLMVAFMLPMQCLMFFFGIIPVIFMPAIFAQFADEGTIGATIRFGEIFGFIRENMTDYIIVLLLSFAVMYLIAPLGVIACVIGVIFTQWWGYLVFGHLTGQLAAKNTASYNEMMM